MLYEIVSGKIKILCTIDIFLNSNSYFLNIFFPTINFPLKGAEKQLSKFNNVDLPIPDSPHTSVLILDIY